jgi:hypothetical protein
MQARRTEAVRGLMPMRPNGRTVGAGVVTEVIE